MKPISVLTPDEANELLFYTAPSGIQIPISKITSISPTQLVVGTDKYSIGGAVYEAIKAKLTTYEGIKLMYAQEDLSKQAASLTQSEFAEQFAEYFEHMDAVINHVNTQAKTVISNLQSVITTVRTKAEDTLSNIDSINSSIKPFKQFAADTNLDDLKSTIKSNVEQLTPVKVELSQVLAELKQLFSGNERA